QHGSEGDRGENAEAHQGRQGAERGVCLLNYKIRGRNGEKNQERTLRGLCFHRKRPRNFALAVDGEPQVPQRYEALAVADSQGWWAVGGDDAQLVLWRNQTSAELYHRGCRPCARL